ncbi:MAG: hypothetical protein Q8O38_07665 [Sulfurimicrobium sp.]|nr:hypothetical protein [Sulfurimicrobium sp.]
MTNFADDISGALCLHRWVLGALALLALAGCASVSPQRITTDRMDYGQVIADSWKRQTLLNVVRMRYADAPVFLEVSSIINSYSVGGKASALATLPSGTNPDVFSLGAEGTWSNTPTVTYQPVLGDRFTKSMLQPVPPAAVFQLLQGGWPAEVVLPTVVGSINGLRNDSLGASADPGFRQLIEVLSRIQRTGGLGIRIEPRKDSSAVVIALRREGPDAELVENGRRAQELLGLEEGASEFDITYGLLPRNRREVAMLSRSMLEIMLQLGFGIELPSTHVADGRAGAGRGKAGEAKTEPLVRIHSGTEAPVDAYAAVPYKGYWYWIDDTDIASKRTFTFLLILFSLAETGQATATPVVTVPSR